MHRKLSSLKAAVLVKAPTPCSNPRVVRPGFIEIKFTAKANCTAPTNRRFAKVSWASRSCTEPKLGLATAARPSTNIGRLFTSEISYPNKTLRLWCGPQSRTDSKRDQSLRWSNVDQNWYLPAMWGESRWSHKITVRFNWMSPLTSDAIGHWRHWFNGLGASDETSIPPYRKAIISKNPQSCKVVQEPSAPRS